MLMDRDDPRAGTPEIEPPADQDLELESETTDDPEDREEELEDEAPRGDETVEQRLARIEQENRKLANSNRELLRMKSKVEPMRRRLRELEQDRFNEYQSRGIPPEERERIGRLKATAAQLASSDDPRDELIAELLQGIRQLDRQVGDLSERQRFRVPKKYEDVVERLMATGDYTNRRGALRAALGIERQRLERQVETRRDGDSESRREAPRRRPEEPARRPVHTVTRGVPVSEAIVNGQLKTMTQSQYKRALSGPKREDIIRAFSSGKVRVVPDS